MESPRAYKKISLRTYFSDITDCIKLLWTNHHCPFRIMGKMLRTVWAWLFCCILFLLFLNLNWFSILSKRLTDSKKIKGPDRFSWFPTQTAKARPTWCQLHASLDLRDDSKSKWPDERPHEQKVAQLLGSPSRLQLSSLIECSCTLRRGEWGRISYASSKPGRQMRNCLLVASHKIRGQMRNALWHLFTRPPILPCSWENHKAFH